MITAALIAIGAAALLVTFLFMDIVDYSYTSEYVTPGEVIEQKYKGKDVSDEETDGAALLVWTVGAGGLALIGGLVGLIPAVARRIWALAVPVAIVMAAWAIYSRTWFNEEIDHLSRTGPGAKISFYAAIFVFAVAIIGSIVQATRSRRAAV